MKTQQALLIIDMQKGSFTAETPRHDTDGTVQRINQLATSLRRQRKPVVHIQHDGSSIGEFIPNTEPWSILDDLHVHLEDIRIDKYANDVFYGSQLQATLDHLGVQELLITGCATDFCVESTIQSALIKDYHITVVSDGHTTGDRPELSAEQLIRHYNWVWQNMLPTRGSLQVKSSSDILDDFNKG